MRNVVRSAVRHVRPMAMRLHPQMERVFKLGLPINHGSEVESAVSPLGLLSEFILCNGVCIFSHAGRFAILYKDNFLAVGSVSTAFEAEMRER